MAAIDKIYINSVEEYNLFREWCEEQPKLKDKYGIEVSLSRYFFQYVNLEQKFFPMFFSAPYYVDAYLIRNCPFEFIQKELKINYGEWPQEWIDEAYKTVMERGGGKTKEGAYRWLSAGDFKIVDGVITMPNKEKSSYQLIKEGKLYLTPYREKKYEVGKHITCISSPPHKYNTPYKTKYWRVSLDLPEDINCYLMYNHERNTWDYHDEFVVCGLKSSSCYFKTIKTIKRAIRKWELPIGTIVICEGRYAKDYYQFGIRE